MLRENDTHITEKVAGLTAPAISHAQRAVWAVALQQAATVPDGNAETFSSEMCCQSRIDNVVNEFKPVNFAHH